MQKKCFVFLTLLAFVSSSAVADDLLRINADIRYRWEYEDNFNQKFYGENPPKGDSDDGKYITPFKGLECQFGYGHFRPGEFVRKMADDVEANWCFFQLHYRFSEVFHERN